MCKQWWFDCEEMCISFIKKKKYGSHLKKFRIKLRRSRRKCFYLRLEVTNKKIYKNNKKIFFFLFYLTNKFNSNIYYLFIFILFHTHFLLFPPYNQTMAKSSTLKKMVDEIIAQSQQEKQLHPSNENI